MTMQAKPFLAPILRSEALTRGLADPEARMLVEWLVDRVERLAETAAEERMAWALVHSLHRRARAIGRFVELWCHQRSRGAATQLAAAEGFQWPLPVAAVDPCELMQTILAWEGERRAA